MPKELHENVLSLDKEFSTLSLNEFTFQPSPWYRVFIVQLIVDCTGKLFISGIQTKQSKQLESIPSWRFREYKKQE